MPAYVEFISGGIVRVGASKEPDPYEYSVTYDDRCMYAVIKGFSRKRIPKSDFIEATKAVNQASGKLISYYREIPGKPRIRVIQINPIFTKGKIVMHKHHVDEAKNADGSVNQNIVVMHVLEACVGILGGTLKVVSGEQTQDPHHPRRVRFTFEADAV